MMELLDLHLILKSIQKSGRLFSVSRARSGVIEIAEASGVRQETKIVLLGHRIELKSLWLMEPKDISEWQHEEFYHYLVQGHDKPRYTLHYPAEASLNIRSIFYVLEMLIM
ncbi:heat shock 75 mitochondrial [Labeo rohita]|uniref:Heat shock 75 mitochondrial n=1 Tax=Labeo rohita TaxID=84645 RepID=A0A498LW57_LABRO|nr:heat shock 75 mitochondrial [Labeo rohita]